MTLKELKEQINGLGPGYNDHEVILGARHHGFLKADMVTADAKYLDQNVIQVYKQEDPTQEDTIPCIVLWS
tara:strand:+ start:1750 stop:1962 length:213 start_codon:yes stop_codon:yes gene_type:complete